MASQRDPHQAELSVHRSELVSGAQDFGRGVSVRDLGFGR